jgi:hypothetical protein
VQRGTGRRGPRRGHQYILSPTHREGGLAAAAAPVAMSGALFAWLISHQPAVLFSQNKPATSNQPAVPFSQNKPAPAISHQPTEQAEGLEGSTDATRNEEVGTAARTSYILSPAYGEVRAAARWLLVVPLSPCPPASPRETKVEKKANRAHLAYGPHYEMRDP